MAKQSVKSNKKPDFNSNLVLPWHKPVWEILLKRLRENRFPSALLLTGMEGSGKQHLVQVLAKKLLCKDKQSELPCGQCSACHWFEQQSHPDYHQVQPEGKTETIKVDAIRQLCTDLMLTSHAGGAKLGIIYKAERMNLNAANSLLKSLEEPVSSTIFILHSHEPGLLPVTIRSRCQVMNLPVPDVELSLTWLKQNGIESGKKYLHAAQGAPVAAFIMATTGQLDEQARVFKQLKSVFTGKADLVALAQEWQKKELKLIYTWLLAWIHDFIKVKLGINQGFLYKPDLINDYELLNKKLDLTLLFAGQEQLLTAIQQLNTSINRQLTLESLLIHLRKTGSVG